MSAAPQHHDRDMYRDVRDGIDMERWLCTEPGCSACIADATIAAVRDLDWAQQHGIQHPDWKTVGGDDA